VLCWARALGEFGATITFAGNLPGTTQTLPLAVYIALETRPEVAIMLSLVLLAVSLAILIASVPLPWMAVLIANDRPPRRAEEPRRYDAQHGPPSFSTAERPALGTAEHSASQPEDGNPPGEVPG